MIMLETLSFVVGIGLSSVSTSDSPMGSMQECKNYLQAQASRYEFYLKPGAQQLEIRFTKLGTEYFIKRTCIEY